MHIAKEQLKRLLGLEEKDISVPPNPEMGDLSTNIAFKISQEKNENPNISAINLMSSLDLSKTIFSTAKAFGPYINFFIDYEKLAKKVLKDAFEANYGDIKKAGKPFLMEFPNPNTNKPFHLGHLLQILLGTSLCRIMESCGKNVKRLNVYNDRGLHICKSMAAYDSFGKNALPDKKPDHFVGKFYALFEKKKTMELEAKAEKMLIDWEANEKKTRILWKKMNSWTYKGFNETFKKIKIDKYDKIYYESEFYGKGKEIVLKGLNEGIFKKEDDGAIYCEMDDGSKKYLLRKNSTSLYITQDLALAKLKEKEYDFEKSVYMTSSEQNHYFSQLFEILEKIGLKSAKKLCHIGTGSISLSTGKMSSREGNVIYADELIEKMTVLAKKEIDKRKSNASIADIEKIALSAIKYHFLKTTSSKDTVFDPKESISFEGNTGPYLLYSLVRAKKISDKSSIKNSGANAKFLDSKEEKELIKSISMLSNEIGKSFQAMSPHILCSYAYSLAKNFNSFYEKCPVLGAENDKTKSARMTLLRAFIKAMQKSLFLIGIEPAKEM